MSREQLKHIIVIGAGVIGLTTAIKIQERHGYQVTVIAETFPSDPKCIKYTSQWAGAHHVSGARRDDLRQQRMDAETFEVLWELSAPGGAAEGCLMRVPQTEYYDTEIPDPHPLRFMPSFKRVDKKDLLLGSLSAVSFTTVTVDVPVYLNYLLCRFLARGGTIVRGSVQHIDEVIEGGARDFSRARTLSPVDAVVVCAGLGARTLGGVEDKNVYPVRGQTVLLRAPWMKFGRTISRENWSYIIPRRSGDVIVGGTRTPNDWYPIPRHETTLDILQRALAFCPELVPPELRVERKPTVEDLLPIVIEEGCGLRPVRNGGIRLEVEWRNAIKAGGKVPVVYNYGHGGYGYQSSWGSASVASDLLEKALFEKLCKL